MAFFFNKSPKPAQKSSQQREIAFQVDQALKVLNDCANLVNSTVKPDVFFGRLNCLFDTFQHLQRFESSYQFNGSTPTKNFKKVLDDLEQIVNVFIDRSYHDAVDRAASLKTEKGKRNSMIRYIDKLVEAFECADSFWTGNLLYPHYTGPLYTEANWNTVISLRETIEAEYGEKTAITDQ